MKNAFTISSTIIFMILVVASIATANVPNMVGYQGQMSDSSGALLDTTVDMTFAIYDASTGGTTLWSETQMSVEVVNGIFQVLLGSIIPIEDSVFNDDKRWLGVTVGAGPELDPRTPIVSGAYALRIATVDGATGGDITGRTRIVSDSGDVRLMLREGPTSLAGQVFTFGPNLQNNVLLGTTAGNPDHGAMAAYDETGGERATMWIPSLSYGVISTKGPNDSFNALLTVLSGYPNNGYVAVRDSLNSTKAGMFVSSYGNGRVYTLGPNGNQNIALANWYYDQDNGFMAVFNNEDSLVAGVWAADSGRGVVSAWGPNGSSNVHLTSLDDRPENGHVGVYDSVGYCQGATYIDSSNSGIIFTRGPNGNRNVRLMYLDHYPDNGYVSVWDESDTIRAGMYVDSEGEGIIFADVKNFRMPNPSDKNTEIWYACIEGPEAGAYIRGTSHLVNGRAVVTYEDHFVSVASPEGLTIQLTPLSADSKGLAVVKKNNDGFVVSELNSGKGNYDFDFMVMAVRKGHEDYRIIRPASEARPSMDELRPAPVERHNLIDRESPSEEAYEEGSVEPDPQFR